VSAGGRRFVLAASALALAVACGRAVAAHAAPALEPRIVNGNLTADLPSVAAVVVPATPADASTWCSATLIGCETALTAAHCVCNGTGADCQSGPSAPVPALYGVFLQHAGFFGVSSIWVHPDFDYPVADVAVLHLSQPVEGIRPTPINQVAVPAFGTPGTIAGFGRGGGATFDYGLKRVGAVETASCVAGISNVSSVCWDFAAPVGPPGTDSNTCNGDSGGPLLIDMGGGPVVAGTTSGGTSSSCSPLDHSFDANVYEYRAAIAAEGGADLSNAACGAGPQVDDPTVSVLAFGGSLSSASASRTHFFAVPNATERLVVTLNASEASGGDFDLYVKRGSPPTATSFDCRATGPSQYGACEIAAPAAGTWWVEIVRAAGSGTYQATATLFRTPCTTPGAACDDGNPCTSGDVCGASGCAGTVVADGTSCDDGRLCTPTDACSAGACVGSAAPRTACKQPLAPGAATLTVRNASSAAGDSVAWTLRRGAGTTVGELGDPTLGDPVAFCVYDAVGGATPIALEVGVAAPEAWRAVPHGYRFRDRSRSHGGADSMQIRAGSPGLASATFRARGPLLELPALPFVQAGPLVAQLVAPGACFSASFSSNLSNTASRFHARSD